jgi:site-specific recombinase XerC
MPNMSSSAFAESPTILYRAGMLSLARARSRTQSSATFRFSVSLRSGSKSCTRTGTALSVRNSERDFKVLCGKAGITGVRRSWHTLRHSFAVNYLRAGGNLYYLQRILGQFSITSTERYLRSLGIADLQAVHNGRSLLKK